MALAKYLAFPFAASLKRNYTKRNTICFIEMVRVFADSIRTFYRNSFVLDKNPIDNIGRQRGYVIAVCS